MANLHQAATDEARVALALAPVRLDDSSFERFLQAHNGSAIDRVSIEALMCTTAVRQMTCDRLQLPNFHAAGGPGR